MAALPGCVISDLYADLAASGSMTGLAGTIVARASSTPLFVQQSDSTWIEHANVLVSTRSPDGLWTLVLPSQSNCDPSDATWAITLPDGTTWSGPVTDAMVTASLTTPLTLHDLKDTYGWALASTVPLVSLASYVATTTALGMVTLDQNPTSGNPIALTAPRRGTASGVCDLDSSTKVPAARLPAASTGALGAVKVGSGLAVDGSGVVSTAPAAALVKLDEVVVGLGGAPTIAFSGVDQRYRSLQLVMQARGTQADTKVNCCLQFNGDSAAHYDNLVIYGYSGLVNATDAYTETSAVLAEIAAATAVANVASTLVVFVPNYAGMAFHKTLLCQSEYLIAASYQGWVWEQRAARWAQAAAISSITLFPASGSFVAGSTCTLYGLT